MGKYARKSERQLRFTEKILDDIRSRIAKGESKRGVARSLGINECTLRKRLREGTISTSLGRYKKIFTQEQEHELASHIRELEKRLYGLRMKDVMSLAYQFAELNKIPHRFNRETKLAGKHWIKDFASRQNLSLRAPEKCSLARAIGFNKVQCDRFFQNLRECYKKYNIEPHRLFNMDETGMSTVPNKISKVFAPKGKKCVSKIVAAERGQLITAVCCMNAWGTWVPPALIFPRKRMKEELFYGAPPGTLKLISESGYMNTDLFLEWLRHFYAHVKPSQEEPAVLLLDNHISHCLLEAVLFCREKSIVMITLPPHATHKLQPLYKVYFSPLKNAFSLERDKWMVSNPGKPITQKQMASLFNSAYSRTATVAICQKAFETTGLFPYNPEIYTEDDSAPSDVTDVVQNSGVSNADDEVVNVGKETTKNEVRGEVTNVTQGGSVNEDWDGYDSDDDLPLIVFHTGGNTTVQNEQHEFSAMEVENINNRTPPRPVLTNGDRKRENVTRNLTDDFLDSFSGNENRSVSLDDPIPGPSSRVTPTREEPLAAATEDSSNPQKFTPQMILPMPKATHVQQRRRAAKKSEILTSTPYKDELTETVKQKKVPNVKKQVFMKSKKAAAKTSTLKETSTKQKPSAPDSSKDNTICPGCQEHYSTSEWIRCEVCGDWWHEDCSNYLGTGMFTCDYC